MGIINKLKQMKSFLALAFAGVVAAESQNEFNFMQYVAKFGKNYSNVGEWATRFNLWAEQHQIIEEHNAKEGETFTMAHNQFSDWTQSEYDGMLGDLPHEEELGEPTILPESNEGQVDWRSKGAVTAVKNQGSCGSCWSFSTAGGLEGVYKRKTGQLISFSEQQGVDCITTSYGCDGGSHYGAYGYYLTNKIERESDYPYEAKDSICRQKSTKGVFTLGSRHHITNKSVSSLKNAIAHTPTSVSVDASNSPFRNYSTGVVTSSACGTSTNHAILAVGYGSNYYIVKNSWGKSWGDAGYIRIGFQDGTVGICGIQTHPSYGDI